MAKNSSSPLAHDLAQSRFVAHELGTADELLCAQHDLPSMTMEERDKEVKEALCSMPGWILGPFLVGWALAEGIFAMGPKSKYNNAIDVVATHNLSWLYFSAVMLSRITSALNMIPVIWKGAVMRLPPHNGNLRANLFIYKVIQNRDNEVDAGNVLLAEKGDEGAMNRANRSLTHFVENSMPFFLEVPLAAFVFPQATFVVVVAFGAGRIWHQIGYAVGGWGEHGGGFLVAYFSECILAGICFTVACRAFGAFQESPA